MLIRMGMMRMGMGMMMTVGANDRVTGTMHFFSLDLTSMTDNQRWIGEPNLPLQHMNKEHASKGLSPSLSGNNGRLVWIQSIR